MKIDLKKATATVQGLYYLVTGVWGIVALESFQNLTGPKMDLWLVRVVAALVLVIGMVLIISAMRNRLFIEIVLLGAGSALALALVETPYALIGRISPIYFADAVLELFFVAGWILGSKRDVKVSQTSKW